MTSEYDAGNEPRILVRHRLRIAREHAGLEQGELAELIGVSRNTISNSESGATEHVRQITLNAWALACGVPVTWIRDGPLMPNPPGAPLSNSQGDTPAITPEDPSIQPDGW